MNDADLEMLELTERGNAAAAGICVHCDDYIDAGTGLDWAPYHAACMAELERQSREDEAYRQARRNGEC